MTEIKKMMTRITFTVNLWENNIEMCLDFSIKCYNYLNSMNCYTSNGVYSEPHVYQLCTYIAKLVIPTNCRNFKNGLPQCYTYIAGYWRLPITVLL